MAPLSVAFVPDTHPAMHPGRCARVVVEGRSIGFVGELHPQWRQSYGLNVAPVVFELELDGVLQRPLPEFKPVARQQPVQRDIAVVVAEQVSHAALMACIHATPTDGLLREAALFDIYRPKAGTESAGMQPGEKSFAVRLTLNGGEATLADAQIDATVAAVVQTLQARLGARQRV